MGSNLSRKIQLLALLTPSWDPPFRYREYSGRRRSLEVAFEKKADVWLCLNIFVKHVRNILIYTCLYKSVINS